MSLLAFCALAALIVWFFRQMDPPDWDDFWGMP